MLGPDFTASGANAARLRDANHDYRRPHGYIFEVPADGTASAAPLRAMGRFVHEAVSVDPETGIVYETGDRWLGSGFYRFMPAQPGNLAAGGSLEMLAIGDAPGADLRTGQERDVWRPVVWAPIDNADPAEIAEDSVYAQGVAGGGATFARLEGTWYGGGLVLCEDGETDNFVRGLTLDGKIFPFATNNVVLNGERNGFSGDYRNREFAGATYSPDGRWLFFNIQTPGITFAVTGPWADGPL